MSFPRYERYKDSGVEWLGEMPEHWGIEPLYRLGKEREESNIGLIDSNLLSLSYGRIIRKDIETNDGLLPESFETYQIVRPGDVIFRLTDLQNDKRSLRTAIVSELGIITFAYVAFCPKSITPPYLNYLLRDYDLRKIFYSMGGGVRQSMKFDDIKRLPTLVPPENEQSAIADFLDFETAKIDALIEEQRRLIELLKEKRQAVISHAITKGLNPETSRTSCKLKHLIKSIEQGWSPQCDNNPAEDGEWAVLKVGSVNYGVFNPRENKALPLDIPPVPSLGIAKDDVLISRANTRELVGSAAVAENDYPRHLLCDKIYRLKVRANLCLAQYIGKFLGVPEVRAFIEATATGASQSMVNIGQDVIRELPILLPTLSEQKEIVAYLKTQEEAFATLTREATKAIALLQERRRTLISAAVTGKIDVCAYIAKPAMSTTQYSSGFAHQLLAAEILDRCNSQRMGRIKLQKLIHLCEYHGQVSEVQGDYSRKAAGPFDAKAMAGISKNLKKQKWFEDVREGERYVYRPLEKHGEHKKYLAHWQAQMPRINVVLSLLGNLKTRECEIVSTLYAAWNDLLIDSGSTDDAAILHEASSAERWHKSKEQIAPERWKKALQWMKDKGLVPVGYGKHTRHNAGQIGTAPEVAHEPA